MTMMNIVLKLLFVQCLVMILDKCWCRAFSPLLPLPRPLSSSQLSSPSFSAFSAITRVSHRDRGCSSSSSSSSSRRNEDHYRRWHHSLRLQQYPLAAVTSSDRGRENNNDSRNNHRVRGGGGGGVVITGAAGGVGFAYAREFVNRGYDVVLCDVQDCSAAAAALMPTTTTTTTTPTLGTVYHCYCDVSNADSVIALGKFAQEKLGTIQYWINNAGINGGRRELRNVSMDTVQRVVNVNLLGTIYCTKVALDIFQNQKDKDCATSHIFNTVGSGVKGGGTPGYACYGATKRGIPQFTASLVKELDEGIQGSLKNTNPGGNSGDTTKVLVHNLSPGMVFTKLLLDDSTPELRKFPFGVLAAQPEEVAADLVPKMIAANVQGSSVEFLTPDRILTKFVERFILGKKSAYIDDDGNVIQYPGEQYDEIGVRSLY